MINEMSVTKYRKLVDVQFEFNKDVNVISGTNGTCKTSVLYLASNSFKKVVRKGKSKEVAHCLSLIGRINKLFNPKIESLTRGDKTLNDPAPGVEGTIMKVNYKTGGELQFRKHISEQGTRFSVKPKYKSGAAESLPEIPVLYLGLSRLVSYGEFEFDDLVNELKHDMPLKYQEEIVQLYSEFTGVNIESVGFNDMGGLKTRGNFISDRKGVDSNTISAGEDNLYIILTALVSLKYYYEVRNEDESNEGIYNSILAVDELDATLHPSYQVQLFDLIKEYSEKYEIQFFCTTHSLYLIEYALESKVGVFYLMDQIESVYVDTPKEGLDMFSIKMYLENKTSSNILKNRKIPVFLEDEEARGMLEVIFEYLSSIEEYDFHKVAQYFHLVDCKISSSNLTTIFKDRVLMEDLIKAICILDGDCNNDITNNIISLPGQKNPEELIFEYLKTMVESTDKYYKDFWKPLNPLVRDHGYTKVKVRDDIINEYNQITVELESMREDGRSTKGIRRDKFKKLFQVHSFFLYKVFGYWLADEKNKSEVSKFYNNFRVMFLKTALAHNINKSLWKR